MSIKTTRSDKKPKSVKPVLNGTAKLRFDNKLYHTSANVQIETGKIQIMCEY